MSSKELSSREEIIARELALGKDQKHAYQAAFPKISDVSSEAASTRYLKANPQVKQRAIDIIQDRFPNLNIDRALKVVDEGLEAKTIGKYAGDVDYAQRLAYARTLLELHKELGSHTQSNTINIDARHQTIELSPDYIDRMERVLDRFDKMKRKPVISDGEIVQEQATEQNGDRG